MNITSFRCKSADGNESKVEAFIELVLDNQFAVHDLKTIKRDDGSTFLQMPCRRMQDKCPKCNCKNYVKARFCNWCGEGLADNRFKTDANGRQILTTDIFHPISKEARQWLESEVHYAIRQNQISDK